jgi:Zn-dependent M28 family amino/carboxypeptidase
VNTLCRSRYADTLAELTSYPARHSLSSHFHDAARRARDRLQMMGYEVHLEEVGLVDGKTLNVVADKRGAAGHAGKVTLVAAHLDSACFSACGPDDVTAPAPGVNDNGSGSAGVLEMARVLRDVEIRHDLRFILFGGQEQGLHGSRQYVQRLDGPGRARIGSVVNMDMIGVMRTDTPTVLLEGGATVSGNALRALASAAHTYTGLTVHTSYQYDGSDHVPFIEADMPAVLTVEGSDTATEDAPKICDTVNHINYDYALDILRMNTAFIVQEAGF